MKLYIISAQGSDEEKELMNEYLTLLNERNLLVRREQYLNLLENIRDYEQRFNLVQQELGNLIQVEGKIFNFSLLNKIEAQIRHPVI